MSYIKFDKKQLVNLEYSLSREILRSNRAGSYASTTITGCNTRKYHGLLVVPQPQLDNENHVLLSGLDESVIQHDSKFNLAIRRFRNDNYEPKGHKYLREYNTDPVPKYIYRVGGVLLQKERLFVQFEDRILIRYTLLDAHSDTKLSFKPFLAFRNAHSISKANNDVNRTYEEAENGVKLRMYDGYDYLHMQFSKEVNYDHSPDWYYDIEYLKELERGYEGLEDLYVPGSFEVEIKKGESIIFSAGTKEIKPSSLQSLFSREYEKRTPRSDYHNTLQNAAEQFFIKRDGFSSLTAGYHWFGKWGRDTFIALPGTTLTMGREDRFVSVMKFMMSRIEDGLFPNKRRGNLINYDSSDTSLWFIWALQQFAEMTGRESFVWDEYGQIMQDVINSYMSGEIYWLKVRENGLIYAGNNDTALTWMDTYTNGQPVNSRHGYAVEVNALWYNALCYISDLSEKYGDGSFKENWKETIEIIPDSFKTIFWNKKEQFLYDCVSDDNIDDRIRPNAVFACSMMHSPLSENKQQKVLEVIRKRLLTPRGLRTLTPEDKDYCGTYVGPQIDRDKIYHHGTVFPWLLGAFVEGYLKIHGKSALHFANEIYNSFEEVIQDHGVGSISEIYDGDPPHHGRGAISQAWSVGEVLRIKWIIDNYQLNNNH